MASPFCSPDGSSCGWWSSDFVKKESADWLVGARLPFLLHCGRETEVFYFPETLRPVFLIKNLLFYVKFCVNIMWQLAGGLVFLFVLDIYLDIVSFTKNSKSLWVCGFPFGVIRTREVYNKY